MLTNKKIIEKKIKLSIEGWLFISPVILGVIIFTYIPTIQSFIYSFFKYDGFNNMKYVGFENYISIFTTDIETCTVFKNTFLYCVVTVPLSLILGYLVALIANNKIKGIKAYRVLFYLPVLIPSVSSGILWKDIFDPSTGIMYQIINALTGLEPMFFTDASSAMSTLIWTTTWGVGGGMVIWLAAFKNIPEYLYESAKLDGAGSFRQVIAITIPMSTSMIFYNLVTGIIGSLQVFSTFIIAGSASNSGRGPDDSLYFIAIKIYDEAFSRIGRMGYACAYAFVLFIIIAICTAITFRTSSWVNYAEDM